MEETLSLQRWKRGEVKPQSTEDSLAPVSRLKGLFFKIIITP